MELIHYGQNKFYSYEFNKVIPIGLCDIRPIKPQLFDSELA